jgi:hypothetical protein
MAFTDREITMTATQTIAKTADQRATAAMPGNEVTG